MKSSRSANLNDCMWAISDSGLLSEYLRNKLVLDELNLQYDLVTGFLNIPSLKNLERKTADWCDCTRKRSVFSRTMNDLLLDWVAANVYE